MYIQPLLNWIGGKRQLLNEIHEHLPSQYNNYYEPFLGAGSVLLSVQPHKAIVGDYNKQLINTYIQARDNVNELIIKLKELQTVQPSRELFLKVRSAYNEKIQTEVLDVETAAYMIFLSHRGFNGLYRVNKSGLYNVPFGTGHDTLYVEENVRNLSAYLNENDISISAQDFEETCKSVSKGDFIYFDSPYVDEPTRASFTSYTKDGFSLSDHERLAALFKELDSRGAFCLLSNNDGPLVYDLYKGYNIKSFFARRSINRNGQQRTGQEVLVMNYEVATMESLFYD